MKTHIEDTSRLLGDLERRAIEACAPLPPPVVPDEVGVIFKNHLFSIAKLAIFLLMYLGDVDEH